MTLDAVGVEIVEVRVPALLEASAVAVIEGAGELTVVVITRHGRTSIATTATHLRDGDLVHVAVAARAVGRLEQLLVMC